MTITIKTGNESFAEPGCGREVARILRDLARRMENAPSVEDLELCGPGAALDTNGNRVCEVHYEED